MNWMIWIILLVLNTFSFGVYKADLCDHEQVLLDNLFEKYNTRIRPAKNEADTVQKC